MIQDRIGRKDIGFRVGQGEIYDLEQVKRDMPTKVR